MGHVRIFRRLTTRRDQGLRTVNKADTFGRDCKTRSKPKILRHVACHGLKGLSWELDFLHEAQPLNCPSGVQGAAHLGKVQFAVDVAAGQMQRTANLTEPPQQAWLAVYSSMIASSPALSRPPKVIAWCVSEKSRLSSERPHQKVSDQRL